MARFCHFLLDVDCISSRLKEWKSTVIQIWVNQLRYQIVYQFHCKLLVNFDTEKQRIGIFEDKLNLDTDCKHQHRHYESVIELFTLVLYVQLGSNGWNWDKHLLHVVLIEWLWIQMTENVPISKMRDQANKFRCVDVLNFCFCLLNSCFWECWQTVDHCCILCFCFNIIEISFLIEFLHLESWGCWLWTPVVMYRVDNLFWTGFCVWNCIDWEPLRVIINVSFNIIQWNRDGFWNFGDVLFWLVYLGGGELEFRCAHKRFVREQFLTFFLCDYLLWFLFWWWIEAKRCWVKRKWIQELLLPNVGVQIQFKLTVFFVHVFLFSYQIRSWVARRNRCRLILVFCPEPCEIQ